MEKFLLKKTLEDKCPNFTNKYKKIILDVIENYIYLPDFIGRRQFICESFDKNLLKENIESKEILEEIKDLKKIILDISYGKYKGDLSID